MNADRGGTGDGGAEGSAPTDGDPDRADGVDGDPDRPGGDTDRGDGDPDRDRPGGGFGRGPLGNGLFFGVFVGTFGGAVAQAATGRLVALPAVLLVCLVAGGVWGYRRDRRGRRSGGPG